MTYKISAGVYQQEIVKGSGSLAAISGTIGACVFASKKGPLGPRAITGGWEEFVSIYGNGDTAWSPAHLVLKPALKQMTLFYGNRIVSDAKYAGLSVYYNDQNKNFFTRPFTTGTSADFETALRSTKLISFSNYLVEGDVVTVDLGTTPVSQEFNSTSNYTLDQLSKKIGAALDEMGAGGECSVIKAWNLSDRKEAIQLTFSRNFVEQDLVSFKISGVNITESTISASYTESSDGMFQALVTALNEVEGLTATVIMAEVPAIKITCNKAGPANLTISEEQLVPEDLLMEKTVLTEGHGVYDDRVLLVTLPETIDDLEIGGSVEGSSVTVEVESDSKLMDIFAENPGAWASDMKTGLGIKITGLDEGTSQRLRLTISKAIKAGESFEASIGYGAETFQIEPVEFAESSDNTLKLIAAAIQKVVDESIAPGAVVTAEEVVGGTENDRSILVIGPNPDVSISINNPTFSGSDTAPNAVVKEIIPNTPANQQFMLGVYARDSLANPLESWVCSMNDQLDSTGNQMFVEERINKGAYESANIRVVVHNPDYSKLQEISSIAWLGGGEDGVIPSNSQIMAGWDAFADREQIDVRLLIDGGYTDVNVAQKIAEVAKNRKDAVALLSIPSDKQKATDVADYRKYEMNVNTSYAACYAPDVLVFDENAGTNVYIAPSGYAAAAICYTERNWAIYWAAAGLTRGLMDGALGVRYKYNEGDRDLVEGVHVNPIRDMGTAGVVIFGEYTTQTQVDPLTDLHSRLLANNIEIYQDLQFRFGLFDPNDEFLRAELCKNMSNYLEPIKQGRGIRDYQVISDINTESPADVDMGALVIKVKWKPTSSTKYIMVKNYILGSGVSFDEEIG